MGRQPPHLRIASPSLGTPLVLIREEMKWEVPFLSILFSIEAEDKKILMRKLKWC